MNVNYYLKDSKKTKTAINCIIRHRGFRYKLSTGVSILTEFWTGNRAQVLKAYPEAEIINIQLDRFENNIKKIFEPHIINKTAPPVDEVRQQLQAKPTAINKKHFTPWFESYYKNSDYAPETIKKYKTTYNWLLRYERELNTRLTFEKINIQFYDSFKTWILKKTYTPKKGTSPRHYSLNYFGSLVKCIKVVMAAAGPQSRYKIHNNTDYKIKDFAVTSEPADTIYLSTEELLKIHQFTPTIEHIKQLSTDKRLSNLEKKRQALILSKNKFLIGAFTALRVSDFNRMDEVNIQKKYIRIKPKKGTRKNNDVIIPIHPVITQILATGFKLNSKISEQKINKHIKEVCKLVEITEPISTTRTEGGKQTERTAPKYTLVSTHTARRSGATNMYLAGIPSISIMKITGHRTENSFLKYIRISQEENARLLSAHPFFNDILK